MTLNPLHRHASLLLALLPLLSACSSYAPDPDTRGVIEAAQRDAKATQNALAALPPECTLGTPGLGPRGHWLIAPKATGGAGQPIVYVYTLAKATTTRVLHVGLNRQALQTLEKVETRDVGGNWSEAGPVARHDAPAACEFVWLEQQLPAARQVEALRYSFRRELGTIKAANAGVLQDPASQPKG